MEHIKTPAKKKIGFSTILNVLVVVISVCLVTYFFVSKNGFIQLINSNQTFLLGWIGIAFIAHLINLFIDAYTIKMFLGVRYDKISIWDSIKISMVGQFFSALTPSATGGQPMQIYLMSKMNIEAGYATSVTVQKLIVYQLVTTFYSIIAILLRLDYFFSTINHPGMLLFTTIGFSTQLIFTSIVLLIAFNKKIATLAIRFATFIITKIKLFKQKDELIKSVENQVYMFYTSNKAIMKKPKTVIGVYLLVFVQATALLSIPYFIYRSFGYTDASVFDIICSQAYVNLSVSMMPLPGASGAAELGFAAFFAMYFAPQTIKSAILVWRMVTYYGTILLGLPFARFTNDKKVRETLAQQEETSQNKQSTQPIDGDIKENEDALANTKKDNEDASINDDKNNNVN